ncbi:MAG: PorV/PorQ family protein [Candidatus Zixiibacteriota bacterium]|nr:MAG: PorV/PorQ family protein [candidate division Zixibacteria bacterium]
MRNKVILAAASLFLICTFVATEANSKTDKSGTSTLSFLKFGTDARAAGMGEAFVSFSDGVTTPFWNPASISGTEGTQIGLTHSQWVQDITAEHFSSAIRAGDNAFGLSVSLGKVPDIERREGPTTEPLALFDAHDMVLSFSYARHLKGRSAAGITVKWIYEKIDVSSASGLGFDLGGIWSPFSGSGRSVLGNLAFGAAISNLGSKIKFEKEAYSLPTQYRAGVSYFAERDHWQSDVTMSLDVVKPRDDDSKIHLGGECGFHRTLKLRLGYQIGYDEKAVSFGMGVEFKNYAINYAFVPYKSDLGDVHYVSLDVQF